MHVHYEYSIVLKLKKILNVSIVLAIVYIIFFFTLSAGIFNGIIEGKNYNIYNFLPTRALQNNFETVVGTIVLIVGFIGTLIIYRASSMEKINEKYGLLAVGFIILSLSIVFIYKIVEIKV